MNPSPSKGATSWFREVVENSAALVAVMAPEIKYGLRVARDAISLHADSITRQARSSRRRKD
jgi:hypothetical protein